MLKGKQTRGEAFQDDRHRWGRKPHTERVSQGRRLKRLTNRFPSRKYYNSNTVMISLGVLAYIHISLLHQKSLVR